jgi:hypothetical protein
MHAYRALGKKTDYHYGLGNAPAEPSTPRCHASRAPDQTELARTLAGPTPTRGRRQNTSRTATTTRRSDLLTVRRTGSPTLVLGRRRMQGGACVGQPTGMHASACSALPRRWAGCVSSLRSMAKPRAGALERRADSDPVCFSVKTDTKGSVR